MPEPVARTGAQVVLDALCDAGVDRVFGYPGGAIMPLYDTLLDSPIEHVLTRHEQAAIHAADAYARASGRLGVCIATSGPGATNLVTGICTALMDSSPVLCLTGQVPTPTIGTDAFQEADVLGIVSTVTKQAYLTRSLHELPEVMSEAIYVARSGRPGPVVVDLPKNVLSGKTTHVSIAAPRIAGYEPTPTVCVEAVARAHALLRGARRPVCVVGGGCKLSGATALLRAWCRRTGVPVAVTLNGLGALEPTCSGYLGMLGMHGLRAANRAVAQADVLIGLGMRFDDRVTGRVDEFARGARVIHVDIDAAEIGKIIPVDVGVHADLSAALEAWLVLLDEQPVAPFTAWQQTAAAAGDGRQQVLARGREVSMIAVLDALCELVGGDAIVTTDVGQHQMWAAQRVRVNDPRRFITSGGAGTMGFGLPAAVGAQMACLERRVVAVLGDGGFQMSQAELATIRRCNLPVKIAVLDNRFLGMVRQWQDMFYARRYSAVDMSDNPDFAALARVYGLAAYTLDETSKTNDVLRAWWQHDGPALLHCVCAAEENVFPMVPAGATLGEMLEASG